MNTAFFSTPAVANWMFYSVFVACIVSIAALAGHDLLRVSNRPVRWIWVAAIGISMALAIAAPFRIGSRESTDDRSIAAVTGATSATNGFDDSRTIIDAARDAVIAPIAFMLHRTHAVIARAPMIVFQGLMVLWVLSSLALTCGFVVGYRRMMKHVRGLRRAEINGTPVHVSPSTGPAVIGLFPSEIVVSEWLTKRPMQEQHIAVAHELEHIRSSDPWILVVACSAVALMPWNPILWYCLSRLRLAIEIDCDRRTLQRGVGIDTYGSLLIEISSVQCAAPLISVAFPGSQSHLERRLIAMTERSVKAKLMRRVATALIGATALVAACESNLPTTAELKQMDAAAAERHANAAGMLNGSAPKYVVDGKSVDAAVANALTADEIASISVAKGKPGTPSEIRIITVSTPSSITGATEQSGETASSTVRDRQASQKSAFEGLLIVDGVIANASMLNTISPDRIASMEVLKSEVATAKYRDRRASKGVILITTKP